MRLRNRREEKDKARGSGAAPESRSSECSAWSSSAWPRPRPGLWLPWVVERGEQAAPASRRHLALLLGRSHSVMQGGPGGCVCCSCWGWDWGPREALPPPCESVGGEGSWGCSRKARSEGRRRAQAFPGSASRGGKGRETWSQALFWALTPALGKRWPVGGWTQGRSLPPRERSLPLPSALPSSCSLNCAGLFSGLFWETFCLISLPWM